MCAEKDYMTDKDQFYFQGKYFDSSEEMFEYSTRWLSEKLDQETAERLMKNFSRECVMNIFLIGRELTNGAMCEIIEKIFQEFLISLNSRISKKEKE